MQNNAPQRAPELDADEARQSRPVGRIRYVLGIGIALTVLGFFLAYFLLT